jgi:hypothetical protein
MTHRELTKGSFLYYYSMPSQMSKSYSHPQPMPIDRTSTEFKHYDDASLSTRSDVVYGAQIGSGTKRNRGGWTS